MAFLRPLYFENAREIYVSEHEEVFLSHAVLRFDSCTKELVIKNCGRTYIGANLERELEPNEVARVKNGNCVSFGAQYQDENDETKYNSLAFIVSIADQWNDPPECVTCGICHEVLNLPVSLKCGHLFCRNCVTKWAQSKISQHSLPTCPKCRVTYSFYFINKSNIDLVRMIDCIRDLQKTLL